MLEIGVHLVNGRVLITKWFQFLPCRSQQIGDQVDSDRVINLSPFDEQNFVAYIMSLAYH